MLQEEKINVASDSNALPAFAKRAIAVQSEVSEKLIEAGRHCLDQLQAESHEAIELLRKFNDNATASERVTALQDWLKGATERGAKNAAFAVETVRAVADIEARLFVARLSNGKDAA